jgi:hypothetical protein
MTTGFIPQPITPPQESTDGEITVEELMRRQDALVQLRMAQQQHLNRVENESLDVVRKYPELDPDSDSYVPELSESLVKATMSFIQHNPTESVTKFVDGMMSPYKKAVEKQSVVQKETITKQVSEQAMRPTQVPDQEKPFEELSIEEMEKKLGVSYR